MKPTTREWVKKAEDDKLAAHELAHGPDRLHDQVCFHCQQSAEKYLKALLEEQGLPVPKTHDLEILLSNLATQFPALLKLRRGLSILVDYAVDSRYPGNHTTKRQATSALRWAVKVRVLCRNLLGLPPDKKRKP